MISYKPFFETLAKKNISEYELIFKQGISANTIHRIKKGEAITTKTLDTLCFILDCSVSEILEHDKTKWKSAGAGYHVLLLYFCLYEEISSCLLFFGIYRLYFTPCTIITFTIIADIPTNSYIIFLFLCQSHRGSGCIRT